MAQAKPQIVNNAATLLSPKRVNEAACVPTVDRVFDLMPGFVYVFNHVSYSNDYANRSVAEHLGYSSEEIQEFGTEMFMTIVHPDDHPQLAAHLGQIASLTGEDTATLEYRVLPKDGGVRWLRSVDAVFDRSGDGTVLRHIGCANDITTEKVAQLRLKTLNAELEYKVLERTRDLARLNAELEKRINLRTLELQETIKELEQLTYVATHDLKVPLNNLERLGRLLLDSAAGLDPSQSEHVQWINICSEQLSAKVKDLVQVSQIRRGAIPPQQEIDLCLAIHDFIEVSESHLARSNPSAQITTEIEEGLTVWFSRCDFDMIFKAVMDNALAYAKPDRPLQITIRGREDQGRVVLTVEDNGRGIDMAHDIPKVFGLFQRAHKYPTGRGVSLYCAERMLSRAGGEITVTGQPDIGATFQIFFPKRTVES